MSKKIIIVNPDHPMEIPFDQQLTIGRDVYNSLSLQDSDISRSHAIIFEQDGRTIIKDLNSRNGVHLNGTKVNEHALADGDEIVLGSTVMIFNPREGFLQEKSLSPRAQYILNKHASKPRAVHPESVTVFTHSQMERVIQRLFTHPEGATFFSLTNAMALLRSFYEMAVAPTTTELFRQTLIRTLALIGGDRGVIMEADIGKKKLKVRSIISHEENATKIEIPRQVLKVVLQAESCVFCPNVLSDERFENIVSEDRHPIHSFIAAPIMAGMHYFGFIYLDSEQGHRGYDYVAMRSLFFIATLLAAQLEPRTMHFTHEPSMHEPPKPENHREQPAEIG